MRPVLIVLILLLASFAPVLGTSGAEGDADGVLSCPRVTHVDAMGPVCRDATGLLRLFDDDGAFLGFTHGPDPAPEADEVAVTGHPSRRAPQCVDAAVEDHYVQVIYARAFDTPDNHGWRSAHIVELVEGANARLNEASGWAGVTTDVRVRCVDGDVHVANAVLPTSSADWSFSTIVSDLQDMGFDDSKVKYWVWYDDRHPEWGGQGHVFYDDRLTEENRANGNAGYAGFAVTYGLKTTRIMLHELGHTLGAVQHSAPHSSGAWHCTDGRDTMCYDDGGPHAPEYTTSRCQTEVFDCGRDDYFNADPPAGSYLATHWNLGSPLVRYFERGESDAPPGAYFEHPVDGFVYRSNDPLNGCLALRYSHMAWTKGLPPLFTDSGCVTVRAWDDHLQIARVTAFVDGEPVGELTEANRGHDGFEFTFPMDVEGGRTVAIRVVAENTAGETREVFTKAVKV